MPRRDYISEVELINIIADNLRDVMKEKRYSQKELAFEAGISEGALSSYLNKQKLIGIRALINICEALDCNADDLLPFKGTMIE